MGKEKIIIDTDIGTEVDDAITLAYLLANPRADILGITTVTGEATQRAKLASVFCEVAGRDIPIYPGCEEPLLVPQIELYAPQQVILNKWKHRQEFPKNQAVSFLQQTIRENPGEITLVCIAPLTNIGLLFAMDPEIPSLLKRIVLMCGSPTYTRYDNTSETMSAMQNSDAIVLGSKGVLENNALIDPHATKLVYAPRMSEHVSFGLNVTSKLIMKPEEAEKIFHHPILLPVLDIAREWFKDEERVTFHDPLAAVALFHQDICEYQRGNINVETNSDMLAGFTYWRPDECGKHKIATKVDEKAFFKHLFEVFEEGDI
ncbi:nucleoside hydrolase [Faecalicatena contorta]|uniref:Purine nucleosidase n=1 Tax=Faecalicatena contorta TaxID=39482 RepID=A0A316A3J2_9FIRM|nr:nucleoside hydrolase [Faecalicatena contorta]PWJ52102.1 purine nucleosidase [Faecalicatena contorta]SUQ12380.1 purine nucleosidase [Faecalicatena contorta]